jgi:hypothetical protein
VRRQPADADLVEDWSLVARAIVERGELPSLFTVP